jgi:hypothetical protein
MLAGALTRMRDSPERLEQPHARLRGTRRARILTVIGCFAVAPAAGIVASRLVLPQFAMFASVAAIWASMYPIALLNRRDPWWAHWLRGAFLALGFWIVAQWLH